MSFVSDVRFPSSVPTIVFSKLLLFSQLFANLLLSNKKPIEIILSETQCRGLRIDKFLQKEKKENYANKQVQQRQLAVKIYKFVQKLLIFNFLLKAKSLWIYNDSKNHLFFIVIFNNKIANLPQSIRRPFNQTCSISADCFFKSSFVNWAVISGLMSL